MRDGIKMSTILSPLKYEGAAYLSFDPGGTTGVVQWDEQGIPIAFHHFNEEQLDEFLDLIEGWPIKPRCMVLEEWRNYGSVATIHICSKNTTSQIIGVIKRMTRKVRSILVEFT